VEVEVEEEAEEDEVVVVVQCNAGGRQPSGVAARGKR